MEFLAFLYVGEAVKLHKISTHNFNFRVNFLIMFELDIVLGDFY
jgi:hypothetical protein